MRWPSWLSSQPAPDRDEEAPTLNRPSTWLNTTPTPKDENHPVSWTDTLNSTHWTSAETLLPTFLLTATTLSAIKLYTVYLRRIPQATFITPASLTGKRSIFGYVSAVGDGDTFRLYHTPGGRALGWGWLPGRRVARFEKSRFKDQTIQVRIAGVDAPELAHFGKPEQPYGKEALAGLRGMILGRFVRVRLWRQDQYQRVVGTVTVRTWGWKRDVGLWMLRDGHATVYEAKFGSEFGGKEEVYRKAEAKAKSKGVGLWKGQGKKGWFAGWLAPIVGEKKVQFETPRQFKDRTNAAEKAGKEEKKI